MTTTTPPRQCRSCGAPVIWQTTVAGRPIPLDPTIHVVFDESGVAHRGRNSHFSTCPNAKTHRKRGTA
jgi:hypothetical protein